MSSLESVRFSILDRSRVRQGHGHPETLRDTVEFARAAERWGYHRFWVSEHHTGMVRRRSLRSRWGG